MTVASTDELLVYLADLVDELERYAVTVLPPADREAITLGRERTGNLVIDLEGRLPTPARSGTVDLDLFERWRPMGAHEWARVEYAYELRHHELRYRRAFHRHDEARFLRAYGVATHEHCEATMGTETCGHYFGQPVMDVFDGFRRLYATWLTGQTPDCNASDCLG